MNSISVHAISMVYELRVLESRLSDVLTVSRETLYLAPRDIVALEHCLSIVELLQSKIERTGEYIASLEREVSAAVGPEASPDLGADGVDLDSDR